MNIYNHKNTILIIIIVLLAFFGYWFFFLSKKEAIKPNQPSRGLTAQAPAVVTSTPYDKEFVTSLLGLNSVSLDVSIFDSKVYQALSYPEIPFVVNYTRDAGRNNPFLPIGVDVVKPNDVKTQVNVNPSATTTSTTPPPATIIPTKASPKTTVPAPGSTPKPKTF